MVKLDNLQIAIDLPGEGGVESGEGWEESGNWCGESGKGGKAYEEMETYECGRCITMKLCSLCADCDEYMGANIDAILFSVNNTFDCKLCIMAERTAIRMATIYCRINGPEHNNS